MPARFTTVDDATIGALLRAFYGRARLDPVLGPVFEGAVEDWEGHFETLTRFWSSAMLGSGRYKGDALAVHRAQPIRPEHFDLWLGYWSQTARALFAPELAALFEAKAAGIGESLKLGLFFRP
ncbi:MAG TPA: group III truncated hemoglobin [Caulobacteraceae bacterium]|jgi:hemoglobin|nr:group III truncated hemoglobin [Caulobacteraceae bacterium]